MWSFGQIAAVVLMLVLVVTVAPLAKTTLNIGKTTADLADLGITRAEANDKAFPYFENLLKKVRECGEVNRTCGCNINFRGFSPNHLIEIKNKNISLYDISEGDHDIQSKVLLSVKSNFTVDCIYNVEDEIELLSIISEKEGDLVVSRLFIERTFLNYKKDFNDYEIYNRNGKLCWLDAKSNIENLESCT
jgi:hypothetical protein